MVNRIEIKDKPGIFDAVGSGIEKDISDLGIRKKVSIGFSQIYNIEGNLAENQLERICQELLADGVYQEYSIGISQKPAGGFAVEVTYNQGVMDPVEESVLKGIRDLGIEGVTSVKTAKRYLIKGNLSARELKIISEKLLYNKLIQHVVGSEGHLPVRQAGKPGQPEAIGSEPGGYRFNLVTVDLLGASDKKLQRISRQGQLFLNVAEMRRVRDYFKKIGRNPTDCELETIAQTWSEHCWHKTFRGKINYTEITKSPCLSGRQASRKVTRKIDNLLKATIMKVTNELNKPWCVSVFKDNAGVIRFDRENNICFKVETHNHPSALEPFGGANTGIGGVIRDPLGTGLGARPILNTDVFCFGPVDYPFSKLPQGTLHPRRIMKGVVSGVRDYGNKMGIPTVNGAILFHEGFVGNPLVYCGTAGIMPKGKSFKQSSTGDLIVVAGGRTGRDGIHGATFSSGELTHESETISSGAVQIGNPIQEKKLLDVILQARDKNLYDAITDCGAGGLSSAVGEMGQELGARVDLEKVPLKYSGLSYTEIWISESQERMVLSVPKKNINKLLGVFSREDVEATVIGEFTDTKKLELYYQNNPVCELDMNFLHEGLPALERKAFYVQNKHREPRFQCPANLTDSLIKLLSDYDTCSKEWVIRQYDHEVQAGSVLKPLAGKFNDGPSDAAIVRPLLNSDKGIIISCGINFRYGFIDPYWMAASCIDEALRQVVSVGGSLEVCALLDNFCWGNPDKPDRLGGLVRCALGCYDTARAFGVPFISGKDSLNNEYTVKNRSTAIPGTILISAMAVMPDVNKSVSAFARETGDLIYIVGQTYPEMGGSHYFGLSGYLGNSVPRVYPKTAKKIFSSLNKAVSLGLVRAMHDCSESGIGLACAEMAFSGGLGMELFLQEVPYKCADRSERRNDFILFSESNSRFMVEVKKKNQASFERVLKGLPFGLAGCLSDKKEFRVYGLDNKLCIKADIGRLKDAWKEPLKW